MEQQQLLALIVAFVLISALGGLLGFIYFFNQNKKEEEGEDVGVSNRGSTAGEGSSRTRDRRGMRGAAALRRRAAAAAQQQQNQEDEIEDDDEDEEEIQEGGPQSKAAKRAAKKEEKRKAREEARAAREAQEDARTHKISAYEERQRQKEEEREEREREEEEEQQRIEEERRKKEEEEAAKWMDLIKVEGAGEVEQQTEEETAGLLQQFVDAIIERKMVVLDDLAADFKLRTSDVISRIKGLEEMGTLTGVMDDRGKFIYVSREEMASVANYIRSKGRVKISELAQKSNELVDLEAKEAANFGGDNAQQLDLSFDDLVEPIEDIQIQQSPIQVS
eukprot:TRINITY_DN9512_c0_g5_i2.p1 TRINITY_DN9512_c0_g5~~TRINITY_DN9512_c0_g5_i2.p1  ORF type:complete len:334 (+),score=121.30 TRINITY_DN9512_c0_g5_i2:34-1035(+)